MTDQHATFEAHRDRLFGIAYRMTAGVRDAEDVLQDAWLRWSAVDPEAVEKPEAFLVSTVTRLCIDRSRSAARRRETYVGPWLPEPIVDGVTPVASGSPPADPAATAEQADSLTLAFLVLLDRLTPAERAAFLLHDVFGYPFEDVAAVLDRSTAAVRQLASRARRAVAEGEVPLRHGLDAAAQATIAALLVAIASGDVEATMAHLAPDVMQLDDGGVLVRAARRPIMGAERVARMWVNLARRQPPDLTFEYALVNGGPGIVFRTPEGIYMVVEVGVGEDGLVHRLTAQLNPDKLAHLSQ